MYLICLLRFEAKIRECAFNCKPAANFSLALRRLKFYIRFAGVVAGAW